MGSGGTEWDTGDNFESTRLNQKTRFVGTSTQAENLITSPQAGQQVFATASGTTFGVNKIQTRKADNLSWSARLLESTEYSDGTIGNTSSGAHVHVRYHNYLTLPTTEKFYIVSALEYGHGSAGGSVIMGASLASTATPTAEHMPLVALSAVTTSPGTSSGSTKVTRVMSKPLRGGSILAYWANTNVLDSVGTTGGAISVARLLETYTESPPLAITTDLTTTPKLGLKIYYRGYS